MKNLELRDSINWKSIRFCPVNRQTAVWKSIMENWIMRAESEVSYENFFSSFIQSNSN